MEGVPTIALLGYGEAGSAFGRDLLVAGARVRVYDPQVQPEDSVEACSDEAEAARGADLVLSVNSSLAAVDALRTGLAGLSPNSVWADLNSGSPGLKTTLEGLATEAGMTFADVAIMAPVPGKGLRVPMLVSGGGAERVTVILGALGTPITVQPGPAGAAAQRKLLRSVFFKGLAASVVEALEAARAAGCEEWLRENIAIELAEADASTVERLVSGTHQHAKRRVEEMAAAAQMLDELGVPPLMAGASRDLLRRMLVGD